MWLYNIAILLYLATIKVASLWVPKAKLWCDGRKNIFKRMSQTIAPDERIIWIHASSLGEFEQGRPLIEEIRKKHPEYKILLTFFSPSGYELRKDYKGADYIFYLPIDTSYNARRFLKAAHPEVAIFVKYEFWLNMLFELRRAKIKTYIISAIFRPDSIFFKPMGELWRRALMSFNTLFVQNAQSKELLASIGVNNVEIAGDTRFDRVAQIAKNADKNPIIEEFKGDGQLFVAGSTWPPDEELLLKLVNANKDVKFIIAPHEIASERVEQLAKKFPNAIRYTKISGNEALDKQVIILDTMGQLSSIYSYAAWAYVGGGFGVGIHNTLEASTFGLPMAFGPNYKKFKEATDMVEIGGCQVVERHEHLTTWFEELRNNNQLYEKVSKITKQYTLSQLGATEKIMNVVFSKTMS